MQTLFVDNDEEENLVVNTASLLLAPLLAQETVDDMVRQMGGMSGVKLTPENEEGEEYSPEEYRKRFMSPTPFNPIDLSE